MVVAAQHSMKVASQSVRMGSRVASTSLRSMAKVAGMETQPVRQKDTDPAHSSANSSPRHKTSCCGDCFDDCRTCLNCGASTRKDVILHGSARPEKKWQFAAKKISLKKKLGRVSVSAVADLAVTGLAPEPKVDSSELGPVIDPKGPAAEEESKAKMRKKLKKAFDTFDKDKSGDLSQQEFREIMSMTVDLSADTTLSEAEFEEMFARVDLDRSGRISFEEYFAWVQSPTANALSPDRAVTSETDTTDTVSGTPKID